MTVKLEQLLLVLGGTLLGVGLVLGLVPVKADGVTCGTALTGQTDDAFVSDLTASMMGKSTSTDSSCEDSLSGRRAISLGLGLPGLALAGVGFLVKDNARVTAQDATRRA